MTDFWNATKAASASGPLTQEDLNAAVEAVYNAQPHPCTRGEHVVPSKARYRPGFYICGNCGVPVRVEYPLSERCLSQALSHGRRFRTCSTQGNVRS